VPLLVPWFPWAENQDWWLAPVMSRPGNWDCSGEPSNIPTLNLDAACSIESNPPNSLLLPFVLSSAGHKRHRQNISSD